MTEEEYENSVMLWQFSRIVHTILHSSDISYLQENLEQPVPSWSAFNALCSKEDIQQKHVGFLPVIPYPVTQHATVYTALLNFNNILYQLDQNYLPVACDEGVYAIAREVELSNPDKFENIVLDLGAFHIAKILLGDEGDEMSFNCISVQNGIQKNHPEIYCLSIEEADFRMMIHSKHASQHGFTKIVLVSADTDIIVLALFH